MWKKKRKIRDGLSCYKKVGNKILSDKFIEEKSEKIYSGNIEKIIKEGCEEEKRSGYIKKIFLGGIASFGIHFFLPGYLH